ncbi:pilus assembly protein TadG-related protein [Branchiibius cervicis]|uniref:Pilus assembly protein TadG-related protein n=1 Tax=Branchiibius cervicis TaxID=908252 RepID=A0ABW2AQA7_9MICO
MNRFQRLRADGERGRVLLLGAGLFALLGLLVMGGIDVTAIQLARVQMIDAADAAALDAADAVDPGAIYRSGVGQQVALSDRSVRTDAAASLGRQHRPGQVTGWAVIDGTGSSDGRTARVVLRGTVHPPLSGGLLALIGKDVTITVQSDARSDTELVTGPRP